MKTILAFFLLLGLFGFYAGCEEAWFVAACQAAAVVSASRGGVSGTVARTGMRRRGGPSGVRRRVPPALRVAVQEYPWRVTRFYQGGFLEGRKGLFWNMGSAFAFSVS